MNNILIPDNKVLRKMGYLKDQKGILKRYFREEGNWHSHIDNCHEFILEELKLKKSDIVLVLGSGWLLDFPIEKVVKSGAKLVLADVFHPRQIIQKVKNLTSIELVNFDITGGLITEVYSAVRNGKKGDQKPDLKSLSIPEVNFSEDYDFVISLNILNQLDILLVDYLEKYWDYNEEEIIEFRGRIQEAHLKIFMDKHGILISDSREIHINKSGESVNEKVLIHTNLPKGKIQKSWTWKFDTQYLYNKDYNTDLYVEAISF